MKATKYTITVAIEVLDPASARCLLNDVARAICSEETPSGELRKSDGDSVTWATSPMKVDF